MSWDLKIGEIKHSYISDIDIWQAINHFYFHSQVTTSYKFGFFKSLLENLYNVNDELVLNYNYLFYSFTKIYWNLVVHHGLWQSNNRNQHSVIQRILETYSEKYAIPKQWSFDKLDNELQLKIVKAVKTNGKRYFIGAFYGDTNGLFYEFNLKAEHLKFNKPVYEFLQHHQRTLIQLTNYQLAKFLEKNNNVPHVDYLLTKVEVISRRSSLDKFYQIINKYENNNCFYCSSKLKQRSVHLDHFIPWSFIQTDDLWNLVLSCQRCNLQKSDKVAESNYLDHIIKRNDILLDNLINEEEHYFEYYLAEKLITLYEYSRFNGYTGKWKPYSI
ncbi:HNH endonuclease [Metabacillus lacus]|nr:HNH endonuclease [Metabacillus lacus]